MFPTKCAFVIAAAALLIDVDTARGEAWGWMDECGCANPLPTACAAPPQSSCLSRPFWMRPTPPYYSSWASVPVTNYRPQTVVDPLSGVSFTSLQPCNTYEWQMRRTAGCSLWQRFVAWWHRHHDGPPRCSPAINHCVPSSECVASSPAPAASPYYAPATNGRLVPVPSGVLPASPVPADRRPQLDPLPQRPIGEGSASRPLPADLEVFVRSLNHSNVSPDAGPPLVAPNSDAAEADVADDRTDGTLELLPVSWSGSSATNDHKLPTDEVWDDTGWRSEQ